MKQITTKKWALSAFLIAALGSQYYFSVSSQSLGLTELSSEDAPLTAPAEQNLLDSARVVISASESVSGTTSVSATSAPAPQAEPAAPAPAATEAQSVQPCDGCRVLTREEINIINRALDRAIQLEREAKTRTATAAVTAAVATIREKGLETEKSEIDCSEEKGAEKIRCEREKREQARRDREDAKREKETEAQELRNEEFITKMEDAVSGCRERVECIARRYSSLLRTYSGRRKIEASVAREAYATYIEPHLKRRLLAGEDVAGTQEIIKELSSGIPMEYRQIKEQMVLAVKAAATVRADQAKELYRQSQAASSQKNYDESVRLMTEFQTQNSALRSEFFGNVQTGQAGYVEIMADSMQSSDPTTWAYVKSNLITPIQNLFNNMIPTQSANGSTQPQDVQQGNTRGNTRGGTTAPMGQPLGNPQLNGKMSPLPQNNNGVIFNNPTATPQGTRTRR